MNYFQPRRGGGPGGPMRAGLMVRPDFRNYPFQNTNQNRRGGNNNFNRSQNQEQQKTQQNMPIIPPPSPGPALTMKGPMQQQEEQKPATEQSSQPKVPQTPSKPSMASPPPSQANQNQQMKSPVGNEQQQKQPPPQSPKLEPQQGQKPGPQNQQGQKPGPQNQQGPKPGPQNQQGPKPGPQNQQGPKPGNQNQQGPKPGNQNQQGPKPGNQNQQGPKPGQQSQQGQNPGQQSQQGQNPGQQNQQGQNPGQQNQQGQKPGQQSQQDQRSGPQNQQGQRSGVHQGQRFGSQNQQSQRTGPQQNQRGGPQRSPRPGQHQRQWSGPQQGQNRGPPAMTPTPQPSQEPAEEVADYAMETEETQGFKATLSMLLKPGEKSYTQRCRLFVGNLPGDFTEEDFRKMFGKYGEPSEVFINRAKGFGFIRLESRALAEIAKADLDETPIKGRVLRVRFASHSAALSVKNLSPFVSNELLEEAFSQFGMVERAVVIVDDRGRSTGRGIVEFASRPAARKALDRCNDGVFLLTTSPRPVVVEPLEQFDCDDGLPEKLAQKNPRYQAEHEEPPRFARPGTFEYEYSKRWKSLDEMEKQQREQVEKNMQEAREKLESEMEDAYHEHQANLLRQDLLRRQEELRRMEELHNQEMQKRKEMQLRQDEERRRREEELLRKREMEEQMRRQREESYMMSNYMDRDREMRMHSTGTLGMGDMSFGGTSQNFSLSSLGFDNKQGMGTSTGSLLGSEMRNERFSQGGARGMSSGNTGFSRVREEFDGPAKKPRF